MSNLAISDTDYEMKMSYSLDSLTHGRESVCDNSFASGSDHNEPTNSGALTPGKAPCIVDDSIRGTRGSVCDHSAVTHSFNEQSIQLMCISCAHIVHHLASGQGIRNMKRDKSCDSISSALLGALWHCS